MAGGDEKVFPTLKEQASMEEYWLIIGLRPAKFDQKSSNYHLAKDDEPRCDECAHFFVRHLDGYNVCEIVRPVPEEPIWPEWTCQFQTPDGQQFPLMKGKE